MLKELANLLRRAGGPGSLVSHLAVLAAFGVLVPWVKGFEFLDPLILLAYTAIPILFVAPASTAVFAEPPKGAPAVISKLAAVMLYGWGIGVLVLLCGLATVNIADWYGHLVLPSTKFLIDALLLGFCASLFVASLGALLTSTLAPNPARNILRLAFLLPLLAMATARRFASAEWQSRIAAGMTTRGLAHFALLASVNLAALDILLLLGLLARFRR